MQAESTAPRPVRRAPWAPPCFFLGLGLLVWGLYWLGKPHYADEDLRSDLQKVRDLEEARAVVVGASHGKGVDLEQLGLEGQNLSHNGQDLFEMAYIARSASERAPKLETVFIALSYFTFAFDNAADDRRGVRDRIGRRIEMYSAFPRAAFIPGDHAEYAKGLLYPVVTRDHFRHGFERNARRLWRFFTGGETRGGRRTPARSAAAARPEAPRAAPPASAETPPDPAEDEGLDDPEPGDDSAGGTETDPPPSNDPTDEPPVAAGTKRERPSTKAHTQKNEAWYARHAAGRCRQYARLMDSMRAHHPNLERDTYNELVGLVHALEAKHISVVLVTPPYLSVYSACFDARMQRITRTNALRLTQTTGARYVDLSTDAAFTNKQGFFVDSDHLRQNGKNVLAQKLAQALHLR